MEPILVANEAYQGNEAVAPFVSSIDKAQRVYAKGDKRGAFKILVSMTEDIAKTFNFKNCTIQVNETMLGIGWTNSVCRFTLGNGDTKKITFEDIEQSKKTYRFKKPLTNCNLAIYAPNMLDSSRVSPQEATALIVREIGFSFFVWGFYLKTEEGIINALTLMSSYTDSESSTLDKVMTTAGVAFDYVPNIKVPNTKGTKSGVAKVAGKVLSFFEYSTRILVVPLYAIVAFFTIPFKFIIDLFHKAFGINYDDADKFADQFCASYGLGGELSSAMIKQRDMNFVGDSEFGSFMRIYADIFGASTLLYTKTAGSIGSINSGMALQRIESIIHYYEDLLNENSTNKVLKEEIKEKISSLKIQYSYLSKLPSEKYTVGAFISKVWGQLFGADTEAIDRLDKNISGGIDRQRR
jgi:hypothetical protein